MKVFTNINEIPAKDYVVSIGFFDGLHLGHRFVIESLKELARKENKQELLITIWPHPAFVFGKSIELLNSLDEKIRLIEQSGIENLLILDFTKELAAHSFARFINEILVDKLSVTTVMMGFDNSFGSKNSLDENSESLSKNISIKRIPELKSEYYSGISSSSIREALRYGDIKKANKLLGYNYFINGVIVGGHKIGRKLGFPTANLEQVGPEKLIPDNGVYIVKVVIDDKIYKAMLCIGVRPSFGENARTIEFNVLDFEGDLYAKRVRVLFYEKIRNEIKFNAINELVAELHKDKNKVIDYFNEN